MPLDRTSLTVENLRPILGMAVVIWVVHILSIVLDMVSGISLNDWFGLAPRDFGGLIGIPLSPFLHANISHLVSNTVPLIMLGGMTALAAPRHFFDATVMIILLGGALVWLLARDGNGLMVHVGASGLIFGYLGFLVGLGIFKRSLRTLAMAAIAALLYGGMIFGVLPDHRISWESHLFGALAGIAVAWFLRGDSQPDPDQFS